MIRVSVFYFLATCSVIFGALAITRKNPIHSALMLVLSLLSLAGVYVALGAAFLAMAQVFVYAGAIMVLFIFVIMLVGTKPTTIAIRARDHYQWGIAIAVLLFIVFVIKLGASSLGIRGIETEVKELALVLVGTGSIFGVHALAFELGSILVLVSLVGAVLLTRKHE